MLLIIYVLLIVDSLKQVYVDFTLQKFCVLERINSRFLLVVRIFYLMFTKLILLFGVIVITMAAPSSDPKLLLEPVDAVSEWSDWKVKHGKQYGNDEEEANRFNIFKENLKKITEHNKKYEAGEVTYTQGLNQFADLTQEEFAKSHLGGTRPKAKGLTGLN